MLSDDDLARVERMVGDWHIADEDMENVERLVAEVRALRAQVERLRFESAEENGFASLFAAVDEHDTDLGDRVRGAVLRAKQMGERGIDRRSSAAGYARCTADVVAWLGLMPYVLDRDVLREQIGERGEHEGAAQEREGQR